MKITLTGSLGRIGKPLTQTLLKNGHSVTVISSQKERQSEIESMGAKAAIGSVENIEFLTAAFREADVVYLMEPPPNFFDPTLDINEQWCNVARNYKNAIESSKVKRVIHLSSIGAHTATGVGMLAAHYHVENILRQLPDEIFIKFMRPVGFYYNMFAFIPTIKIQNAILQNYGGDDNEPWVSPLDIAA